MSGLSMMQGDTQTQQNVHWLCVEKTISIATNGRINDEEEEDEIERKY